MVEWSWRIEAELSIVCGSWSDEALWEPSFARMLGRQVTNVSTFGRLPEIMLSLSGDMHVLSFTTVEGDPEWTLFDKRGSTIIAVGSRSGFVAETE